MDERATSGSPESIKKWLLAPYIHFSNLYGNSQSFLLDAACGNREQNDHIISKWGGITGYDMNEPAFYKDTFRSVNLTSRFPVDGFHYDTVFSFETIEHLPREYHVSFVKELLRVADGAVVIGTVMTDGPTFIGRDLDEIWKACNNKNEYHIAEYSSKEFVEFFETNFPENITAFYSTVQTPDYQFVVERMTETPGISSFVVLVP